MIWLGITGGTILGSRWFGARASLDAEPRGIAGLLDTVLDNSTAPSGPTRWQTSAQKRRDRARDITWLTHEPLDFLLRRGDHFADEPAHYDKMVSPDNIKRMADAVDRQTLKGLRDRALLLLGFAGALRRSELVALDTGHLTERPKGLTVLLASSKTDQEGAGRTIAIMPGEGTASGIGNTAKRFPSGCRARFSTPA